MYNNIYSTDQTNSSVPSVPGSRGNTFDPRPPKTLGAGCALTEKAFPYRSGTCQYTTTGEYTCAQNPTPASALGSCKSFYVDRECAARSDDADHPQKRFEKLMGKKQ
eukprot:gene29461-5807_t